MSASPAWLEIDLDAIRQNTAAVGALVGPRTRVLAIVKADGYGHGAPAVAAAALRGGARALGVANLAEAVELHEAALRAPILILNAGLPETAEEVVRRGLVQTATTPESLTLLSAAAVAAEREARVHLKLDTGMGRLGLPPREAVGLLRAALAQPGLRVAGIFSHLATAEEADRSFARAQFAAFDAAAAAIREAGLPLPPRHLANSAGLLNFPEMRLDLVRPGLLIYGLSPGGALETGPDLRPALTWKTRVEFVKRVPAGTTVSYGRTWTARREAIVATLPVGYADGYPRALSNRGQGLVGGRRCPVVGAVCMDHIMLEVGEEVGVGDEVVLIGRQGVEELTANDLAEAAGTVVHEIVARLGRRLPRLYRGEASA